MCAIILDTSKPAIKAIKHRNIKNLWILSLTFMLLLTSETGLRLLQSTINVDDGLGVISLSVLYSTSIVSSLLLPKVMIHNLGHKKTLVVSTAGFCTWVAANAYANWITMVSTSILAGLCWGPLCSAQSSYITLLARYHCGLTGETLSVVTSRFMGFYFFVFSISNSLQLPHMSICSTPSFCWHQGKHNTCSSPMLALCVGNYRWISSTKGLVGLPQKG